MSFWLALVLGFGIVARVTRFVNSDVLAEGIRMWADGIEVPPRTQRPRLAAAIRKLKRLARRPLVAVFGDKLSDLVTCPWCLSIYVALPVAVVVAVGFGDFTTAGTLYAVLGLWFGYSYVYALVANNLDD